MRKKSHILVAGYLADQFPELQGLQDHRKAFCFGSILPDLRPSFLTKRHEFNTTFEETKEKIEDILTYLSSGRNLTERVFWRRVGEILHYIADYFTFPHNQHYTGGFIEHNSYEKRLKDQMKEYVLSGKAEILLFENHEYTSVEELTSFIHHAHDGYIRRQGTISSDISYILSMSFHTIMGILQLLQKNGFENFLGRLNINHCLVCSNML